MRRTRPPCSPRWQRLGRLAPFRLPGGEAAIREPWRIALGLALQTGRAPEALTAGWTAGDDGRDGVRRAPQALAVTAVSEMWRRGLNCPPTSSAGRLFDAVSAALGLCTHITYEGQAAIRLEDAAARSVLPGQWWRLGPEGLRAPQPEHGLLPAPPLTEEEGLLQLDGTALFAAVLARLLPLLLAAHGLTPLCQQDVPPGDGGISLGQAAWAQACLRAGLPSELA